MASIYDIKPLFQNLLRPGTQWLAKRGVTANQVTLAALALSLATGALLITAPAHPAIYLVVPLVMLVRMALNAIDGMLAREHHMKSALGAILNELCDLISDAALYLPFALLPTANQWLVVFVVIAALLSETTGIIAASIGASRRYDGPMGKSDRAFVFGALAIALGFDLPGQDQWLNALLIIVLALLLLTIGNRAKQALAELSS